MDRRVDVAEGPLVGRQLAVRVHVPLAQHQHELVLGELGVDDGQRHAVERQVPRGVPRVLPLVRHRDDVGVEQVAPLRVASMHALRRRRRLRRIALEPFLHDVVVVLLRPQQAGQALAHHRRGVVGDVGWNDGGVELVGLALARRHRVVEVGERRRAGEVLGTPRREPQADGDALAGGHRQRVVGGGLGAAAGRVHGVGASVHDGLVDAVLGVERPGDAEQAHRVGFVLGEEQRRVALGVEPAAAVAHGLGGDGGAALDGRARPRRGRAGCVRPRPTCSGTRSSAARGSPPPRGRGWRP